MQHRFSQKYLASKYPAPGFRAHQLFGACIGALMFFAIYILGSDNRIGFILILGIVIFPIAWLGLKLARRFMPELLARNAFFEVAADGVWRISRQGRELLMSTQQLLAVGVVRDRSETIVEISLVGRKHTVTVQGLVSMEAFLMDVTHSFPRARIIEDVQ